MSAFDTIQVEVWRHLLASIAEEMGAALQRTAYSPNIKERLDHSCALFDDRARLLAQAAHIPVHLGAMPLMLQALRNRVRWEPGTMWLTNDPRIGGTHLPDLTLAAPVFASEEGSLLGFVASRAHHADIGGLSPGSLPLSGELFHEGLILSPIRLVEHGRIRDDVLELICANSRTPGERKGDLAAQVAANETGIRRFRDLVLSRGQHEFRVRTEENISYARTAVTRALEQLTPGNYTAADILDDDGAGGTNIRIMVTVTIRGGTIHIDFSGSADQVKGSLNATEAITRSACYYVVRCLVNEDIPTNEGCFSAVEVTTPEGSVVNAMFPAAVAGGNVETSQRIADVLLTALAGAAHGRIPAASQGTMNNITIGGYDPVRCRPFAYYETIGGGAGASATQAGASAIHTHMTNTRNTPVEALESHYPLRVLEYSIARHSGGEGRFRGGDGIVRRIELLAPAHVSILTERRVSAPPGCDGGQPGALGVNTRTLPGMLEERLPAKWSGHCPAGTVLTIRTPGGGGYGAPRASAPA